jgi:triosephosphate isomerase
MKRRKIFAGNWKMYKTYNEAVELARGIIDGVKGVDDKEVVIFPPSPYVRNIADLCRGSRVEVGMQNMYHQKEGAFTGEVSPLMVKDSGCRYILIGHSERRHVFGESDDEINRKVKAAFEFGLDPMICVGELLDERESGRTAEINTRQVKAALKDISKEQMGKVIIAYEPVWAIGTGKVATPQMADDAHVLIRDVVKQLYGDSVAQAVSILYGGSVKPDNILGLYQMNNIDGVLVGGASLKADSFLEIIKVH